MKGSVTMIDITKLEEGLENLSGLDFETAAKNFKKKHSKDSYGVIQLNTKFQIEVAAMALGVNTNELKELPLKKYSRVCKTVQDFLFDDGDESEDATDS